MALVISPTNATMYMQPVGGTLQSATNNVANSASAFDSTSYIGQDSTGGRFFGGSLDDVRIYNSSLTAANIALLANLPPTVATAAGASPSPVTGTTTALSVLGADNGGESSLTYTWAATSVPNGAAQPTYSDNGTNTAKNTTVTFSKAGNYAFAVTIMDQSGFTTTSSVSVSVNQAPTVVVSPGLLNIAANGTQTFTATSHDQFGGAMGLSSWNWTATSGTINAATGAYTAPASHADVTITATSGAYSGTATVIVANATPTVATAAAASPSPVTGTTTGLSVLGADDDGESNLTYTWAATSLPQGAAAPLFSANGTNAAKNATATFSKAGNYAFTVTIQDVGGLMATSVVGVTVSQTMTSIAVSPALATPNSGGVQQFGAISNDQFGAAMVSQPTFTWAATAGAITTAGAYTAPIATSTANITATSGGVIGWAVADTVDLAPTIANPAAASPAVVSGTTASLSVVGADADNGEASLTYSWAATAIPYGATAPIFSVNGTNAAKNTVATFFQAGNYTFTVTATDPGGATATSSVNVTVNQTQSIGLSPAVINLLPGGQTQFTVLGGIYDQFGTLLTPGSAPSPVTWSATGGAITQSGLFTAGGAAGTVTVTATSSALSGSATVLQYGDAKWTNLTGGSWATAGNWQGGTIANGSATAADFGTLNITTSPTVTLDGPRTVGGLIFGDTSPSNNWTLNTGTGGPLTLVSSVGTPTIVVNNQTATVSAIIAGTQGIAKSGAGTFVQSANYNFTGGLTVNAGTYKVTAGGWYTNPFTNYNQITVNAGGTLQTGGAHSLGTDQNDVWINGGTLALARSNTSPRCT